MFQQFLKLFNMNGVYKSEHADHLLPITKHKGKSRKPASRAISPRRESIPSRPVTVVACAINMQTSSMQVEGTTAGNGGRPSSVGSDSEWKDVLLAYLDSSTFLEGEQSLKEGVMNLINNEYDDMTPNEI